MNLFQLSATLALDDSEFQRGISSSQSSASNFGKIAGVAFAAVSTAAAAMAVAVVKAGSEFEAQMSVVESISGATGSELEKLAEKAKYMGATTQFTATEAGQAFEYMAMAGWSANDMLDGLEGIMYAAGASGENLASVADIVTDGLTAFGLSASESGRFADVLAQAAANSNTNIGLMGETFKYVAPVAGAMGYSIEDTAVAIGLMANSGIKGSQAGTALKNVLTNMVKPTDAMMASMEELGIEITNTDGTMRPLNDIIVDLRGSFSELTDEEQAFHAATIAGKYGLSGFLAIVNASDEDFNDLTYAINNASGAAQSMNDIRLDNLQGDVTILGSALEGLAIQIYDSFRDPLREAVQSGTSAINQLAAELAKPAMTQALNSIADGFSSLVGVIANIATAVIPPLVSALGTVVSALTTLAPVIVTVTAAFAVVKGIQAFSTAITAAKAAIATASTATETMTLVLGKNAIARTAQSAAEAAGTTVTAAGTTALLANTGAITAKNLILGVLSGQIGIATAAQVVWNAVMTANPIGLLVVAIAALVAGIVVLIKWLGKESEESRALKKDIEALSDANQALLSSFEGSAAAHEERLATIQNDAVATQGLIDKVYELADAEDKSAQDIAVLNGYIGLLNESVDGLNLSYDETEGALSRTRDETEKYIETLAEQLTQQAEQERYLELTKERIEAEQQLTIIGQKLAEAQEEWGEGTRKYNKETEGLREEFELLEQQLADNEIAFELTTDAIEESARRQADAADITAEAWVAANGQVVASQEDLVERNEQIQDAINSYVDSVTNMFSVINEEAKGSVEEYLQTLDDNYEASERFVANLDSLLERGLDKAIVDSWREAGLDSAGEVAAWSDATDEQIQALNEKMARNMEKGTEDAVSVWEDSGIPDAVTGVYSKALEESNLKIGEFISFGGSIVDGLAGGIEGNAETAVGAITDVSNSTAKAFEDANEIHSPSRAYAEYGAFLIQGLSDGIQETESTAINAMASVTDSLKATLSDVDPGKNNLDQWVTGLKNTADSQIPPFISGVIKLFEEIPSKIDSAIASSRDILTTWANSLTTIGTTKITEFVNSVYNIASQIPGKISSAIDPAKGVVETWGNSLVNTASSKMTEMAASIASITATIPTRISDSITPAVPVVQNWVSSLVNIIQSNLPEVVSSTTNILGQIPDEAYNIGQQIVEGLWYGIDSRSSWFYSNLSGFTSNIVSQIKNDLDINSPSRVMAQLGQFTAEGFIVGLNDMASVVERTISDIFDPGLSFDSSYTGGFAGEPVAAAAGAGQNAPSLTVNNYIEPNNKYTESQLAGQIEAYFEQSLWKLR